MFKSKSSQYDRIYAPCIFKLGFKNVEINLELSDEIYIYIYIFFFNVFKGYTQASALGGCRVDAFLLDSLQALGESRGGCGLSGEQGVFCGGGGGWSAPPPHRH